MAAEFLIPIFSLCFIFLCCGLGCWSGANYRKQQRRQQQALAEQGYQITLVNVNGREGYIATPPQQHVITVQQQPAPYVVDAPPSYNVSSNPNNAPVHYPNNAPPIYYSATPNQPKY
ncbi:uncharacterized protein LOC123290410 isoform X1 [Chrysoperla carnea]|uniref:uncharacterized protein LOC123290410 isoform X1 n=1 Tax=Chrysoperla carnea TaxID=189513 RepID=UPI001D0977DF|nr:uncharacterized protein LOC123290410 isoform X1 [Chrysoperla carnea]